jgi:LmbE family N-acetylglucosaminyl deacetylase
MSIELTPQRVLALAPHPDDLELGMGATLCKLAQFGAEIQVVVFSLVKESLPNGLISDDIVRECIDALSLLGVNSDSISFLDFPVRLFSNHRQEILEYLVKLDREFQPEIIFCPSLTDTHQDHAVIANESVRAFRRSTVLGYELPWNTKGFDPALVIDVTEEQIDLKERALQFYRSQAGRAYFETGLLKNHARLRATVAGLHYAESFEMIRMVLR